MAPLVLSIFPGLGLLDRAFEAEGFTVVRGPDVIWGGDVREFHPPAGVFDGVMGGDPCQSHSGFSNLIRARGGVPMPDMTQEYLRIIGEAQPRWFLRENVPTAPDIQPEGYGVHAFLLDNAALDEGRGIGAQQMRKRRFWFGVRDSAPIDLRAHMAFAATAHPDPRKAVTGRHAGEIGLTGGHRGSPGKYSIAEMLELQGLGKYSIAEMLELQGLPPEFLDHCPFTQHGKRKAIGNGVAQATGRALARAIRQALELLEIAA